MASKNIHKHGDWNAVCDLCGFEYKASQLKEQWDHLRVCSECWSPRQPQDFLRGKRDNQSLPWTRSEPADVFSNNLSVDTAPEGTFTVEPLPVANAGIDQAVTSGDLTTLDGSLSSDPQEHSLTYLWTQIAGSTVTLSSSTAISPTFTFDIGSSDSLIFSLVVNDGDNDSGPDYVSVITTALPNINAQFDPNLTSAAITLSDGNRTVTWNGTQSPGTWYNAQAANFKVAGKWYYEVTVNSQTANAYLLTEFIYRFNEIPRDSYYIGQSLDGASFWSNVNASFFYQFRTAGATSMVTLGFGSGDILRIRLDVDNLEIYIAVNGGVFRKPLSKMSNNGTKARGYGFGASLQGGGSMTYNFGSTAFTYSIPAGYLAFNDVGDDLVI